MCGESTVKIPVMNLINSLMLSVLFFVWAQSVETLYKKVRWACMSLNLYVLELYAFELTKPVCFEICSVPG